MNLSRRFRCPRIRPALALCGVFAFSLSVSPSASWAEGPSDSPSGGAERTISASELGRLSEISTRLASLNETLRIELEDSKSNSAELASSLETSTRELATLKRELDLFRQNSSELGLRAEILERESIELSAALKKADDSLRSLEVSFAEYRKEAERRTVFLGLGVLGAGLVAAAGWTVAILALAGR